MFENVPDYDMTNCAQNNKLSELWKPKEISEKICDTLETFSDEKLFLVKMMFLWLETFFTTRHSSNLIGNFAVSCIVSTICGLKCRIHRSDPNKSAFIIPHANEN